MAISLDGIDRVIHEPARLLLVATLYVIESADYTFLMNQTGLTWGNLSSHMSKLEAADYVTVNKQFVEKKPQTVAWLTDAGRAAFEQYRASMIDLLDT